MQTRAATHSLDPENGTAAARFPWPDEQNDMATFQKQTNQPTILLNKMSICVINTMFKRADKWFFLYIFL